jgi:phosphate transport system substrate-binding protein
MQRNIWILPAVIVVASVIVACKRPSDDAVTFAGSSTIMPLIESLAGFYAKHDIRIRVQGGGSGVGVKSARAGLALVAMVSRELTDEERIDLEFATIARDAVAIIVHKENPLSNIDSAMVRAIYGGQRSTWDNGRAITIINKEAGRATLVVFEEYFRLKDAIRKDVVVIGANGQAVTSVANDPQAIAYVSVADSVAAVRNGTPIKVLKLDGVEATTANVLSGRYPLARPLNLAYLRSARDKAQPILGLLRDEYVRTRILEHDFVPTMN